MLVDKAAFFLDLEWWGARYVGRSPARAVIDNKNGAYDPASDMFVTCGVTRPNSQRHNGPTTRCAAECPMRTHSS